MRHIATDFKSKVEHCSMPLAGEEEEERGHNRALFTIQVGAGRQAERAAGD